VTGVQTCGRPICHGEHDRAAAGKRQLAQQPAGPERQELTGVLKPAAPRPIPGVSPASAPATAADRHEEHPPCTPPSAPWPTSTAEPPSPPAWPRPIRTS